MDKRDYEDHKRQQSNFQAWLYALANRHISAGEHEAAGRAMVLERVIYQFGNSYSLAALPLLPREEGAADDDDADDEKPARERPSTAGKHRHRYGADGKCPPPCNAVKSSTRGRKPAPRPTAEERTVPMPPPIGPAAV